jgi:hypothetical protein
MRPKLVRYSAVGGLSLLALIGLFWLFVPISLSGEIEGREISPYTEEIVIKSSHPLSSAAKNGLRISPAADYSVSYGSSVAGTRTRLKLAFSEPLRDNTEYVITVPKKGWFQGRGTYTLRFRTEQLTLETKQEDDSAIRDELNQNPILRLLPYDADRFSVLWNETDAENRYIFDIVIYYAPGESSQGAINRYRPEAESWIKSTGQPGGTYVTRATAKPLSEHP